MPIRLDTPGGFIRATNTRGRPNAEYRLVASRSPVSGVTSSRWLQTAVVANLSRSRRWCARSP
jgi:hypothetical protein